MKKITSAIEQILTRQVQFIIYKISSKIYLAKKNIAIKDFFLKDELKSKNASTHHKIEETAKDKY